MRYVQLVCVIALLAGCSSGPETGTIKGKVTFKGAPVKEGSVVFSNPKEGGTAEGKIDKDGNYAVTGKVVVGEYQVTISPPMEIKDTDPGKSPPVPVEKNMPNIPMKYRQPGTTPFKETVKKGENTFNFDMVP
jgi:hypothetical protein